MHGLLGDLGPCPDHYGLDATRDRSQVVVGNVSFHLVGVRVDGEVLIPPLPQALIDDVAPMTLRLARDPRHCDPLVGQEFPGRLLDADHLPTLLPCSARSCPGAPT